MANFKPKFKDSGGHFVGADKAGAECWHRSHIQRRFETLGYTVTQEKESDTFVVRDSSGTTIGRFSDLGEVETAIAEHQKQTDITRNEQEATKLNKEESNKDAQKKAATAQKEIAKINKEIEKWKAVLADPHHSPYLDEKAHKSIWRLQERLKKYK